jgi:hypothetical protein
LFSLSMVTTDMSSQTATLRPAAGAALCCEISQRSSKSGLRRLINTRCCILLVVYIESMCRFSNWTFVMSAIHTEFNAFWVESLSRFLLYYFVLMQRNEISESISLHLYGYFVCIGWYRCITMCVQRLRLYCTLFTMD